MRRLLLLFMLVFPALSLASVDAGPLQVFVSVLPLKTFVEQVGGKYVNVHAMVRPGFSPETYDPTPRQIAELTRARLYVRVGVPFEDAWMARIRAANPHMQILDARDGIRLEPLPSQGGGYPGQRTEALDPHVWTSPVLAEHMVRLIQSRLDQLDPAHREAFRRNADAYIARLQTLNRQIAKWLGPLQNRRFLVFHPAWGYFAMTYHLTQIPIQYQGKQPGARMLAGVIDLARREQIRVVFVQPQFDQREAQRVAGAIGGQVIKVDPLAADYITNLRSVARQFVQGLAHE